MPVCHSLAAMFNTAASSSSFTSYPSSEMLSKREASTLCLTNAPLMTKASDGLFNHRSSVQSLAYWMSKKQEMDGSAKKFFHLKQITTVLTGSTMPRAKSTPILMTSDSIYKSDVPVTNCSPHKHTKLNISPSRSTM